MPNYYCGPDQGIMISGVSYKPGQKLSRKSVSSLSPRRLKSHMDEGLIITTSRSPDNAPQSVQKIEPVQKWTYDPRQLQGKTLQDLNLMVLAIEPTMTPFETIPEAAAQLTMNWKGSLIPPE